MFKSKDEERAYLCGKLQGARRVQDLTSLPTTETWKVVVEKYVKGIEKDLAALDIPQLKQYYGTDRVEIPAPWEWNGTFGTTSPVWLDVFRVHCKMAASLPRLGLRKRKPTRVWFEAEITWRHPIAGDWYWSQNLGKWIKAESDYPDCLTLCAIRHEEYDETPQVVTQTDVDRVLGGGK